MEVSGAVRPLKWSLGVKWLKSLNLKVFIFFFKLCRLFVVMRQHNVWCACVWCSVWRGMLWRLFVVMRQHNVWCACVVTHTHQTLCCRITTNNLHNFKKLIKIFKFSDFNKEPTGSLKMILMMIETCWSVFECFNTDILD